MVVNVSCKCGKRFQVRDDQLGKVVLCPACGRSVTASPWCIGGYEVFISYSSRDRAIAEVVCQTLEATSIRCWIAPRNILGGLKWGEAIVGGLESCRTMVLIFSSDSNTSEQVGREVQLAVSMHLPIIPFRIDDVLPSRNMQYFLGASQWLDAFVPPMAKHVCRLVETIQAILKSLPPLSSPLRDRLIYPQPDQWAGR